MQIYAVMGKVYASVCFHTDACKQFNFSTKVENINNIKQ